jgi:hypothetical protein
MVYPAKGVISTSAALAETAKSSAQQTIMNLIIPVRPSF